MSAPTGKYLRSLSTRFEITASKWTRKLIYHPAVICSRVITICSYHTTIAPLPSRRLPVRIAENQAILAKSAQRHPPDILAKERYLCHNVSIRWLGFAA